MRNCIEFFEFFWFFKTFLGNFSEEFLEQFFLTEFFWRNFFGGIFWEFFFGRIFGRIFLGGLLGEFFGRNSLGGILCLHWNWLVCQDFGFCQDFVSMEKEGGRRKDKNFRSLEVRRKYIALKNCLNFKNRIKTMPFDLQTLV